MNPGGNDPFQGGGWPGNQPAPSQSPWPPAGPPQGPPSAPYPPPPMAGGQWQAGQPGPWNAPPMMNPPYGQPPNNGNNKGPWIIGGVIAAAVVLVLAIVLVAVNLGGSDESGDGAVATGTTSARPSGSSQTTSKSPATSSATAALPGADGSVEASELEGVLLSASEIEKKLYISGVTTGPVEKSLSTDPVTPPNCAGVWAPGAQSTYGDSGYTGVAIQTAQGGNGLHLVQAAVLFPDEAAAKAAFQKQASDWTACRFKTLNATYDGLGTDTVKTTGNGEDKAKEFLNMSIFTDTSGAANAITCSRGVSRRANVVVDVRACSSDIVTAGFSVAGEIGKKINGKS